MQKVSTELNDWLQKNMFKYFERVLIIAMFLGPNGIMFQTVTFILDTKRGEKRELFNEKVLLIQWIKLLGYFAKTLDFGQNTFFQKSEW